MEPCRIGVVLLLYNSSRQLQSNWTALTTLEHPTKFVVIDNASTDRTTVILRASDIKYHPMPENVGFSRGVNYGLSLLLQDENIEWAVVINPDCIPPPNYPQQIVAPLQENPKVGIVGSRATNSLGHVTHAGGIIGTKQIVFWPTTNDLGNGWSVVGRQAVAQSGFRHGTEDIREIRKVAWVSFSCAALRTAMLREIGLLDEEYFLYGSDSEITMRAASMGWETWYNPDVTCVHEGSANVRVADNDIQLKAVADLQRFALMEEQQLWEPSLHAKLRSKM